MKSEVAAVCSGGMAAIAHRSHRNLPSHGSIEIARGEPVTWCGSIFTAQVAFPIKSRQQAAAAIALMRQESHCTVADHNMSAFRIKGKKVEAEYDDDGEAHGGQRIKGCLTKLNAVGVAVMVSRVYGGENIGKKRFELIVERTATLLEAIGHTPGVGVAHSWGAGNSLGGSSSSEAVTSASASPSSKKRKRPTKDEEAALEEAQRRAQREAAALAAERRMQLLGGGP